MKEIANIKVEGMPDDRRVGMVFLPGDKDYAREFFVDDPSSKVLWSRYYAAGDGTLTLVANPVFEPAVSGNPVPTYECAVRVDEEGRMQYYFLECEIAVYEEGDDDVDEN